MKTLVILSNLILLGVGVYGGFAWAISEGDWFYIALMLIPPILTLGYIFKEKSHASGWISLYFQRRALEEKKKMERLEREG